MDYERHDREWLSFNGFTARAEDIFKVENSSEKSGDLYMMVHEPEEAVIFFDFRLIADSLPVKRVLLNRPFLVMKNFSPGISSKLNFSYSTRGMDVFSYKLSEYKNTITDKLKAVITTDRKEFTLNSFGLPHSMKDTKDGREILFDINNFSTTQNIGISFNRKIQHLDKIEKLLDYSPFALLLFLSALFLLAQIHSKSTFLINYLFSGGILIFYYLFISYLIRFFGIWETLSLATVFTIGLALLFFPAAFGKRFFFRQALPYLLIFTILFSLVFMIPVIQGLAFLLLVFVVFVHLMLLISKSDFTKWQTFSKS